MPTIKHRRATKAQWDSQNPILAAGELGLEVGVGGAQDRFKLGNGLSNWSQLKYFINEVDIDIDTGRLAQESLDKRYVLFNAVNFADRGDVIPDLYSYFGNKDNSFTPITEFDSSQPVTFAGNASPIIAGGTLLGTGSGIRAMYVRTDNMAEEVTRIGARFRFLPGTGTRTNGGTICLGIADGLVEPMSGINVSMPCHFLSTARTWFFTVWTEGVGQVVLATGDYETPLLSDYFTEYEMQCWLNGTTAIFDLPDGTRHTVVDARIGTYKGNYAFFEGYHPNGDSDDSVAFTHIWAGLGIARIPALPVLGGGGGGEAPSPEVAFKTSSSTQVLLPEDSGLWQDWPGLTFDLPATNKAVYVDLSATTSEMPVNGRTQIRIIANDVELAVNGTTHFDWIGTPWAVPALRARVAPHESGVVTVKVQMKIAFFSNPEATGAATYNADASPTLLSAT